MSVSVNVEHIDCTGCFQAIALMCSKRNAKSSIEEHDEVDLAFYKDSNSHLNISENNYPLDLTSSETFIIDMDMRYIHSSGIKEFNLTGDEMIGKTVSEVLPKNVYRFFEALFQEVLTKGVETRTDINLNNKIYSIGAYPLLNNKNVLYGVMMVKSPYENVEHRIFDTTLNENRRSIIQSTKDSDASSESKSEPGLTKKSNKSASLVCDSSGNIIKTSLNWNSFIGLFFSHLIHLYKYQSSEIEGKNVFEFIYGKTSAALFEKILETALMTEVKFISYFETGSTEFKLRISIKKSGTELSIKIRILDEILKPQLTPYFNYKVVPIKDADTCEVCMLCGRIATYLNGKHLNKEVKINPEFIRSEIVGFKGRLGYSTDKLGRIWVNRCLWSNLINEKCINRKKSVYYDTCDLCASEITSIIKKLEIVEETLQ